MKNKFEAIIFDLGKVVIDISVYEADKYWSNLAHIDQKEFIEHDTYHLFEKGLITSAQYRDFIREYYDVKFSDEDFDRGWNLILNGLVPGIEQLIDELRKRYRLVVLSNTNAIHIPVFEKRYRDTLEKFEKRFYSNHIIARKPEEKAYQTVLDYLQIYPGKIIFLDDKIENIQQARKMGIKGILVTDFNQMKRELEEIGV